MASSHSMKPADRHNVVKKLVSDLKKRFKSAVPKSNRPVLETLMFAACLEDSSHDDAEIALQHLLESFYDLNEIRVSSVLEIEESLGKLHNAAWKAMRIREVLQYTFEKYYTFDLDVVRRKTQELAAKDLAGIPYQTPFIRQYGLHICLGAHVVPVDARMGHALRFLGLADRQQNEEGIAEDLKSAVKKADGPLLFHLVKSLSVEPRYIDILEGGLNPGESLNPLDAPKRLSDLFAGKLKRAKPAKPVKESKESKTVSRKKPAPAATPHTRKAPPQKSKPAAKAPVKKVTKKKPPVPDKRHAKRSK